MAGASFQVPSPYRGHHRWRARSTQSDPAVLARHRGLALPVPRVAQHENRPDRAPENPCWQGITAPRRQPRRHQHSRRSRHMGHPTQQLVERLRVSHPRTNLQHQLATRTTTLVVHPLPASTRLPAPSEATGQQSPCSLILPPALPPLGYQEPQAGLLPHQPLPATSPQTPHHACRQPRHTSPLRHRHRLRHQLPRRITTHQKRLGRTLNTPRHAHPIHTFRALTPKSAHCESQ